MTVKKTPTVRRSISKPRLLKGLLGVMAEYDLGGENLILDLTLAIEKDIVKDAMK